ncbi:MAG: hypothetical protein AB7F43_01110 [Bacteriovoracia bacterium]
MRKFVPLLMMISFSCFSEDFKSQVNVTTTEKNWNVSPEIGLSVTQYKESFSSTHQSVGQTGLDGKISGRLNLSPTINLNANLQGTLAVVNKSYDLAAARVFRNDLDAGYYIEVDPTFSVNLTAGLMGRYLDQRNHYFGYDYLAGPQIGTEVQKKFGNSSVTGFLRQGLLSAGWWNYYHLDSSWSIKNREISLGCVYQRQTGSFAGVRAGLMLSALNLEYGLNGVTYTIKSNSLIGTVGLSI